MLIDDQLNKDEPPPPQIPGKLLLVVKREPWDEFVTIYLPNGSSEYVLVDKAERILRLYHVKDPDMILTHVWNFYRAVLYVDDPTYGKNTGI